MEIVLNNKKGEYAVQGEFKQRNFVGQDEKAAKKYENSFLLKKRASLLQNVIIGTCVGFKKKLRLRYAPEPSY